MYKDESLFSESEPEDENRTTDGDDGDGGKEDNSNDGCNKDVKGKEDKDKCLDAGMTIMTKPTSLLKEHCTTHRGHADGGKEDDGRDRHDKDNKCNEDEDKGQDKGMTTKTKPALLPKEDRTIHGGEGDGGKEDEGRDRHDKDNQCNDDGEKDWFGDDNDRKMENDKEEEEYTHSDEMDEYSLKEGNKMGKKKKGSLD